MNFKDKIASKRTTSQYTLDIYPQKNIIGNVHNVNPNFKTTETPLAILGWDTTSIDTTQIIFTYEGPLYGFAIVLLNDGAGNMVKTWIGEITSNMLDNQYIVTFNKMHTMIYYYTAYYNKNNLSGIFDRIPFGNSNAPYAPLLLLDDPFLLSYIDGFTDKTIYWDTQIDTSKVVPNNSGFYEFKNNEVIYAENLENIIIKNRDASGGQIEINRLGNPILTFSMYAIVKEKGGNAILGVPIFSLGSGVVRIIKGSTINALDNNLFFFEEKLKTSTEFADAYTFEGYFNGPKCYETNFLNNYFINTSNNKKLLMFRIGNDNALATQWEWDFEGIHRTLKSVNLDWQINDISMYIALQYQSPTYFNMSLDFNTLTLNETNLGGTLVLKKSQALRYSNKISCRIDDESNILDFGEAIPIISNGDLAQAINNANISYNNGLALTNNQATFNASKLSFDKYITTFKNPLNLVGNITESVYGETLGGMGGDIASVMTDWKNLGKEKALTMEDDNNKKMLAINRDNNIALAKSNTSSKLMSTSDTSFLNFSNSILLSNNAVNFWTGIFIYPIRVSYLSNTQKSILSEAITKYGIISPFFSLTNIDISIRPFFQYIKIKYWLVDSSVFDIANRDLIIHLPNYNVNQYMLDTKETLGNGFILELST